MSVVELLWPAFVLAIALVFIHSIFGLEIIKRGVIFTDLAIGQIAAIGMALSVAFMHAQYQTAMTLLFALLAAVIITWATKKEFLFFTMLALTVTSSVQSAGVLVVFALLIAPSYAGLSHGKIKPLLFACLFGSYYLDLPTGYAIIFVTVLFSLVFVIISSIIKNKE